MMKKTLMIISRTLLCNNQILAKHHSQYIQDNLPADEEGTTESITTNSAAEAVAAAEAEIK